MSELARLPSPALDIARETWAGIWPDAQALAAAHSDEVDSGVEPRRPWRVDTEQMALADSVGALLILGARELESRRLVGYITWTLTSDPESLGLPIALMGPWYAEPGSRAGGRLFKESLRELRALGVRCCFPHHRTQGRGADLGPFFKLLGAQHIQNNYLLWIGEE